MPKRFRPLSVLATAGQRVCDRLHRFRRDTTGSVAAIVTLLSPVLVGGMGLGGEAGYWYLTQREVQNAADVGAHGAALRKLQGDSQTDYEGVASYIIEQAQGTLANTVVGVNSPPQQGNLAGVTAAVEVTITETVPRMFTAIYSSDPVTIIGRAVAFADGGGPGCIIALSPVIQGAISIGGSADINLNGCDMVSNAEGISFDMNGVGSSVNARCIQTVGTAVTTASLTTECARLRENSPPAPDPYANVIEPTPSGTCQGANVGQNNQTTTVMPTEFDAVSGMASTRFCNGLSVRGDVTFQPGIYFIEGGDFVFNSNAALFGSGMIFYLADGVEIRFNGTADMDIAAPTSGPYAGILFFGSRSATTMSHTINGDAGVVIDGAIYTPASHIDLIGNAATSTVSCTQVIGDSVGFSGNGSIGIECSNTAGNDGHTGIQVVIAE